MTPRDPSTTTMPVETSTGTEHRPIDCVRVGAPHRMPLAEPMLRPGEIAVHTIDGSCHVINTGYPE